MTLFFDGAIMMASAVVALLFLRFWRHTADRLFLLFSIAFLILAINRISLAVLPQAFPELGEHREVFYMIRLAAFLVMLVAIVDKNRRAQVPS